MDVVVAGMHMRSGADNVQYAMLHVFSPGQEEKPSVSDVGPAASALGLHMYCLIRTPSLGVGKSSCWLTRDLGVSKRV